jgi:plasmid stability protein
MRIRHSAIRRMALAVAALVVAGAGCRAAMDLTGSASDEWVRTYDLPSGATLDLTNVNGTITVEGVDGTTLEVRAARKVRSTTDEAAREILPRIAINEDVQTDKVQISTEGLNGLTIGVSVSVEYHVRAPRTLALRLRNTNGTITLHDLDGPVVARTTNGAVIATDLRGGIEARTTNGGLRVDMAAVGSDPIDLHSVNGGVVLGLPETAAANLSLSATNGGVSVSGLPFEATGEQSRRSLKGRLNGGGTAIELGTTNGGVRVRNRSEADDQPEP